MSLSLCVSHVCCGGGGGEERQAPQGRRASCQEKQQQRAGERRSVEGAAGDNTMMCQHLTSRSGRSHQQDRVISRHGSSDERGSGGGMIDRAPRRWRRRRRSGRSPPTRSCPCGRRRGQCPSRAQPAAGKDIDNRRAAAIGCCSSSPLRSLMRRGGREARRGRRAAEGRTRRRTRLLADPFAGAGALRVHGGLAHVARLRGTTATSGSISSRRGQTGQELLRAAQRAGAVDIRGEKGGITRRERRIKAARRRIARTLSAALPAASKTGLA